jgi:hypothetical protein
VGEAFGGDEFMAVKPWLGAIREPSSWKASEHAHTAELPTADLEMVFVYGYRAQDVRSNVFYGSTVSEVVYHTAAVGVVYDSVKHKQRFNLTHTDDIVSLAIYSPGNMVATGETVGKCCLSIEGLLIAGSCRRSCR